jgi:hypothetical protein
VLAQTLVLLALIATFALTAVGGIAGSARARTTARAKALIAPAIAGAVATYASEVAAVVAAASRPGDGSASPAPVAPLADGGVFTARQYVEQAPDSPLSIAVEVTPTAAPPAPCANEAPCSAFVQEARLSLDVVAAVGIAGSGAVSPLARGRTTVTLRLLAQPPYAVPIGVKDGVLAGEPPAGEAGAEPIRIVPHCVPAAGDCAFSRPLLR